MLSVTSWEQTRSPQEWARAVLLNFLTFILSQLEALIQGLSLIFTGALQGLISTRNSSSGQATHSDLLKFAFVSSFFSLHYSGWRC